MNNLIIFTPRTGSTILGELLAVSGCGVNMNEALNEIPKLLAVDPTIKNGEAVINMQTKDAYDQFHTLKQRRIEKLKSVNDWTIKEICDSYFASHHIDFVRYCCAAPNTNVYMTYRKDIVSQFISYLNMVARKQSVYRINDRVNEGSILSYDTVIKKANSFVNNLIYWRLIYELFKDNVILVCYEDVIKPMSFTSIGIDTTVVNNYQMRDNRLIPTPYNSIDKDNPAWIDAIRYVRASSWITNTL